MVDTSGPTATPTADRLRQRLALLARDPGNGLLRSECIAAAMALRDYEAVLRLADEGITLAPGDLALRFARTNALIGLHRHQEAIPVLLALLEQDAGNAAVAQNLGLCYFLLGRYDAAQPYLEQVYAAGRREPDLLRIHVLTLHHLGMLDEAVAIAGETADVARDSGALAGVVSLVYLDAGDISGAAKFAARALAANPDSVDGLVVQGTLRTGRLDTQRAEQQFQRVLALSPGNPRALVGLGMLSLLQQDLVSGRRYLEGALAAMPTHSGTWVALGWVQLLQQDLEAAEASFNRCIELDRNFAEGHGGLASVMAIRGDHAACERLAEVAERLDPEGLSAKFARSVRLRAAGDPAAASALLLGTLARLAPGDDGPLSQLIGRLTRR